MKEKVKKLEKRILKVFKRQKKLNKLGKRSKSAVLKTIKRVVKPGIKAQNLLKSTQKSLQNAVKTALRRTKAEKGLFHANSLTFFPAHLRF